MSLQTFTWFPDTESDHGVKPAVETTKFGDGYELRVPIGINSTPMSWNLTFTRDNTESMAILGFIRNRGGFEAFIWKNPQEEQGVYVCREWKVKRLKAGGAMRITCSFDQVFESTS